MFRNAFWRFLTPVTFTDTPPADGGGGGGNGGGGGGDDKKFSQADLDVAIRARLADAQASFDRKMREMGVTPKDKEELERLRQDAAARAQKELEEKGRYDAALKSKDEQFEQERTQFKTREGKLTTKLRDRTITAELVGAAAAANAIDPAEVAQILSSRIRLTDDFEPEVLDANGNPAFKNGKPLTIAEMVTQYLDEKPHNRKPSGTGGAGARGGKSGDAEGAADGANPELAQLEKDWKEAADKAQQTRAAGDVTRAHQLKRKLDKAKAAAATTK